VAHHVGLPDRSVAPGAAAPLDDAEQVVAVLRVHAEAVQAVVSQWQQHLAHQIGDGHLAEAGPPDLGTDAVAGGGMEVLLGGGERHLCP
jgi:hypothetical protein